jgi:hypothetical protein
MRFSVKNLIFGFVFSSVLSLPCLAEEIFKVSVFSQFAECRHSWSDSCLVGFDKNPNNEILLSQTSTTPEIWEGTVKRDDSKFGLDAITDVTVRKVVDPRVSPQPRFHVIVKVQKKDGTIIIRKASTSFFGSLSDLNTVLVWGPEFENIDPDLFNAKMFLYIGQPFFPDSNYISENDLK